MSSDLQSVLKNTEMSRPWERRINISMIFRAKRRRKKPPSVTCHSLQGPCRLLKKHCDSDMVSGLCLCEHNTPKRRKI